MKVREGWAPSKFISRGGWRRGARDVREVGAGSRLAADSAAAKYQNEIRRHASGSLVDLGCGKAPLLGFYSQYVDSVICVDWAQSIHNPTQVDVVADLNGTLPLDSDSFDTIISSDVLEHIWDHETFFREASRILRPGGHVILGTPFYYWLHEEPHDYFRWTRHALKRGCEEAGLSLRSCTATGGPVHILFDIIGKVIAKRFGRLASGWAALSSLLVRTPPLRALDSALSDVFPLAYVVVAEKR